MLEQIWDAILKFTSQFVIPDWGTVIALLPVIMGFVLVAFFLRVVVAYATAGPKRRGGGRRKPIAPPDVHMPGPSFAPIFAGVGAFLLFAGLVFGGLTIVLGLIALLLTLLYWGREAIAEFDHVGGPPPQLPAIVHEGPPPGVHIPGPSFRPLLASMAVAILFLGLVFGGWLLAVGVLFVIVTLLGWLNDARKEYHHVVAADSTGHIGSEPAPAWPKLVFSLMAVFVVGAVVLNLGWFPPRSANGGAADGSPAPSTAPSGVPGQLSVVAEGVKFNVTKLAAPADKPFKISFDNRDKGTAHDVDILDASGAKVFDGKDFPGPDVKVYDVPALKAGTYKFQCSIHPALMNGELTAGP
jgi:plastocyanin